MSYSTSRSGVCVGFVLFMSFAWNLCVCAGNTWFSLESTPLYLCVFESTWVPVCALRFHHICGPIHVCLCVIVRFLCTCVRGQESPECVPYAHALYVLHMWLCMCLCLPICVPT